VGNGHKSNLQKRLSNSIGKSRNQILKKGTNCYLNLCEKKEAGKNKLGTGGGKKKKPWGKELP